MGSEERNQQKRIMPILFPVILVIAGILYFVFDPSTDSWFFPKCPFHLITGLQCPGCGLQRALHCLLHLDVMGALRFNAFIVVILPVLMLMVIGEWYNYHHWFDWANRLINNRYSMIILGVLTLAWWIVRNTIGL